MPDEQTAQAEAPVEAWYRPREQLVQTLAPRFAYMPAMQIGHEAAPVLDWYCPGEQLAHDVDAKEE